VGGGAASNFFFGAKFSFVLNFSTLHKKISLFFLLFFFLFISLKNFFCIAELVLTAKARFLAVLRGLLLPLLL